MRVEGNNGQVEFDGTTISITRDGMKAKLLNRGTGVADTRIPIASLTAVNFKAASLTKPGWIEFAVPGTSGANGTVYFERKMSSQFEALRLAIEESARNQRSSQTATSPPQTDVVGQLTQLAKLRDSGVLTEAEFEAQKSRLLGA